MGGLYEVIMKVQEDPEAYLGRCSVQRLFAFINGYLYNNENANDHCLDGFDEYVASKFRMRFFRNWADIIEFNSLNDRMEMELFKVYFQKFLLEQKKDEPTN